MQAPAPTAQNNPLDNFKRPLFLGVVFVAIFISARLVIHPFNDVDYQVYYHSIDAMLHGLSPYTTQGFISPPWTVFILLPLAYQPQETWLAVSVALWVTMMFDIGTPAGVLQLIHPIFITLLASSNPEWILMGPGLWLMHYFPQGWGRGMAWVFLATKPQTTLLLLLFDGIVALKQRDWKAFLLAGGIFVVTFLIFPEPIAGLLLPHVWSASVIAHYGIIGAVIVTAIIVALRRRFWKTGMDYRTLGLLLTPVWTPYTLQYNYMTVLFTLRKVGWLRNILYLAGGFVLALLFWRDYHVAEEIGALGMLLLAALLAPEWKPLAPRGKKLTMPTATTAEMETTLER